MKNKRTKRKGNKRMQKKKEVICLVANHTGTSYQVPSNGRSDTNIMKIIRAYQVHVYVRDKKIKGNEAKRNKEGRSEKRPKFVPLVYLALGTKMFNT